MWEGWGRGGVGELRPEAGEEITVCRRGSVEPKLAQGSFDQAESGGFSIFGGRGFGEVGGRGNPSAVINRASSPRKDFWSEEGADTQSGLQTGASALAAILQQYCRTVLLARREHGARGPQPSTRKRPLS